MKINYPNLFNLDGLNRKPHKKKFPQAKLAIHSGMLTGLRKEIECSPLRSPIISSIKRIHDDGEELKTLKALLERNLKDMSVNKFTSANLIKRANNENVMTQRNLIRQKSALTKTKKHINLIVSNRTTSPKTYFLNPLGFPKRNVSVYSRRSSKTKIQSQLIKYEKSMSISKITSQQSRPSLERDKMIPPIPLEEPCCTRSVTSTRKHVYIARKKSHRSDDSGSSSEVDFFDSTLTPRITSFYNI